MSDDIVQSDIDRLTKIVRSISSPFEGVRNAAASRFDVSLQSLGLNPADIELVVIDSDEIVADEFRSQIEDAKKWRRRVDADNTALRTTNKAMLDFIRERCPEEWQRFERPPILPEWAEFEELIQTRVFGGKLPKQWQAQVAPIFDTTVARMQRWANGTVGIPPDVMAMLRDLPPPDIALTVTESMGQKARASRLSPKLALEAAQLLFSGMSKDDVATKLGITKAQAIGIEWTPPPRWRIHIPPSGPLDWMQLWQMEKSISGIRKWRAAALARLGLPEDFAYTADLNVASPEAIQAMRDDYFAKDPYLMFERIALRRAESRNGRKLAWIHLFSEIRVEGGSAGANSEGPFFAAHFNMTQFELFEIKPATVKAHAEYLNDCV